MMKRIECTAWESRVAFECCVMQRGRLFYECRRAAGRACMKRVIMIVLGASLLFFGMSIGLCSEGDGFPIQQLFFEGSSLHPLEPIYGGPGMNSSTDVQSLIDLPWLSGESLPGMTALEEALSLVQAPFAMRAGFSPIEKDPFIAGLLSWFMMGMGQIYAHEYTKGSIFIAADLASKASLILLISHINTKYHPSGNGVINIDWKSFDNNTRFLVVSYFAGSFGLRVYNVIDAVRSAQRYNERYYLQKKRSGMSFSIEQESLSINCSVLFKK